MPSQEDSRPPAPVKVLLLGTTLFSEEIADLVNSTPDLTLAGFVENLDPVRCRRKLLGKPVYWVEKWPELAQDHSALCAIGTTRRSIYVEQVKKLGAEFTTLRHPSAHLSATCRIGKGSTLGANTIVAAGARIGEHVLVNRGATIGHHTQVGSFVTIGPGVNIAGRCSVGDATFIGIGANIVDGVTIGSNAVVGAGAVVLRDVPDRVFVAGVPARIVKTDIEGR